MQEVYEEIGGILQLRHNELKRCVHDMAQVAAGVERFDPSQPRRQQEMLDLLGRIEQAQKRLAAGTYGRCKVCTQIIPPERLLAEPTAEVCIPCTFKQVTAKLNSRRPFQLHERSNR